MTLKVIVFIACIIACCNMITAVDKDGGTAKAISSGFILLTLATIARIFF